MPSFPHTLQTALQITAWLIALAWLQKALAAAIGLPALPDLRAPQHDLSPADLPSLTVIVPARNEAPHIAACLQSLADQDYPNLRILAVNDRSTDETGRFIEASAAAHPSRLTAVHIAELPPGWLGKPHALAVAAAQAIADHGPDFLLFTDADVLYAPSALRRALAQAVATRADHFVLMPTMMVRRWDEALLLGFFQIFGLWGPRLWRVDKPKAIRDHVGIGAFNLMRTSAYLQLGGFASQRFDILEDLTLARRVKQAGLRQRVALGRDLVRVHWAAGARGLIGVMTKNLFAAFHFHISLLLAACGWLALFCIAPTAGLFYVPTRLPALLVLASVALAYRLYGRHSGIAVWNVIFFPVGAAIFLYALLRSMVTTLFHGGVTWRGTFYPLAELRRHTTPRNRSL